MSAPFPRSADLAARVFLFGALAAVIAFSLLVWMWPRSDVARRVDWIVSQPVPFSHEHHVSGLGLDCRFCHASVEVSDNAGMPPTHTCMTCHSEIWTNAEMLAPVRDSLAQNLPMRWNRVTDLPDYVYFSHRIHVAKGVGCASCHGDVARMPLMSKAKSLTMGFCLDCHRDPAPQLRPKDKIFDTGWKREAGDPSPQALAAANHLTRRALTDCSICHR